MGDARLKIPFSCGGHEVIDSVEKALDSRHMKKTHVSYNCHYLGST